MFSNGYPYSFVVKVCSFDVKEIEKGSDMLLFTITVKIWSTSVAFLVVALVDLFIIGIKMIWKLYIGSCSQGDWDLNLQQY